MWISARKSGYQIRLDNVSDSSTRIRFVHRGGVAPQMVGDPGLKGVQY